MKILVKNEDELREAEYLLFLFGYVWRSEEELHGGRRGFLNWSCYAPCTLYIKESKTFCADSGSGISVHDFLKLKVKGEKE